MDPTRAESLVVTATAARAAMRRGDEGAGQKVFEAHHAEMRDALDWLITAGRADDAFRLSSAMTSFWLASNRVDDGRAWLEAALETGQGSDASRARGLHDLGYLAFFSGDYDLADRSFAASRELAERAGDRDVIALALAGLARVGLDEDPQRSVALLREAIAVTQDLPDSLGRSSAEHVLGVALQLSGDLEGAGAVMRARLAHARETDNEFMTFVESANLSMVERKLGNLDAAELLSRDALRIVVRQNDQMAIPWVVNGLAAVTAAQGDIARAARLLAIAETLLARAGGEWPADEREQHDETLATLTRVLTPDDLRRIRAQAEALSQDAAVEIALG
jgi:hypothetical protein